ncbi:MAG: hypothetical protein Harvfovirus57_10 [Harvfovirus sp.]|uniref:Uncharacterized protein n=1 Tax=Harvfovirus sp. TaxID=2487768 RepID=A0A3G5A670_9VIRU|nr:MAG: hypothetical protein Harvfovirus57_10 [Harvfovirus sp.]
MDNTIMKLRSDLAEYSEENENLITRNDELTTENNNLQIKYDCLIKELESREKKINDKNIIIIELSNQLDQYKKPILEYSIDSLIKFFEILKNDNSQKRLIEWFESNVDGYNSSNLGIIYQSMDDTPKAIKWYTHSLKLNYTRAAYFLGKIYYSHGNIKRAIELYEVASEHEHSDAMMELGKIFEDLNQRKTSLKWYKKAADLGNENALIKVQIIIKNNFHWSFKCHSYMLYWLEKIPKNHKINWLGRLVEIYFCMEFNDKNKESSGIFRKKGRKYFKELVEIYKNAPNKIGPISNDIKYITCDKNKKYIKDFLGLSIYNDTINLLKNFAENNKIDPIGAMLKINDDNPIKKNYWLKKIKDIAEAVKMEKDGKKLVEIANIFHSIDDLINAKCYYKNAYEIGELQVAAIIGDIYLDLGRDESNRSIKSKDNIFMSIGWYKKALDAGDFRVNANLAEIYELTNKITEAIKSWTNAYFLCPKISKDTANKLGSIYSNENLNEDNKLSTGSQRKIYNLDIGISWYLQAANLNDIHAMIELAKCYMKADKFTDALNWCDKAMDEDKKTYGNSIESIDIADSKINREYINNIRRDIMEIRHRGEKKIKSTQNVFENGLKIIKKERKKLHNNLKINISKNKYGKSKVKVITRLKASYIKNYR